MRTVRNLLFVIVCCSCVILCTACFSPKSPARVSIVFRGVVLNGRLYSQPFGSMFRFELVPGNGGWLVRIADAGGREDLSSPPAETEGPASRNVRSFDFASDAGDRGLSAPPYRRYFSFTPRPVPGRVPPEPGQALFSVLDFGVSRDDSSMLAWMQFECVITWSEWNRAASSMR